MTHPNDVLADDFSRELINRFFDRKSYFYQSIEGLFGEKCDDEVPTEETQLLLANVLDHLIASPSPVEALTEISSIRGFSNMLDDFLRQTDHLKNSQLAADELRSGIAKLAQLTYEGAVRALRDEETRASITGFINGERHETSRPGISEVKSEEVRNDGEPSTLEPETAESDTETDNPDDCQFEIQLENKDVPTNDHTDVSNESDDEGDNSTAVVGSPAFGDNEEDELDLSSEPGAMLSFFQTRLENQLSELTSRFSALKEGNGTAEWKACQRVFGQMAETAMVYGLESFEQVATKAGGLVKKAQSSDYDRGKVLETLHETVNSLSSLVTKNPDSIGAAEMEHLIETFSDESKFLKSEEMAETAEISQPASGASKENAPQFDLAEFKLPGEDDEEIVRLMQEQNETSEQDVIKFDDAPVVEQEESEHTNGNGTHAGDVPPDGNQDVVEDAPFELLSDTPDTKTAVSGYETSKPLLQTIRDIVSELQPERFDAARLSEAHRAAESLYEEILNGKDPAPSGFVILIIDVIKNIRVSRFALSRDQIELLDRAIDEYLSDPSSDNETLQELTEAVDRLNNEIIDCFSHFVNLLGLDNLDNGNGSIGRIDDADTA